MLASATCCSGVKGEGPPEYFLGFLPKSLRRPLGSADCGSDAEAVTKGLGRGNGTGSRTAATAKPEKARNVIPAIRTPQRARGVEPGFCPIAVFNSKPVSRAPDCTVGRS